MQVRLIAGKYGGRLLDAPNTNRTHPMSERARNALFNSISERVSGADVLDVFAGTGAVGLEALSRGAQHVTFIERDRIAQKCLKKNIATLGVEKNTTIIKSPVAAWLDRHDTESYDVILADPPYHDPHLSTVKRLFGLLKPNGLMVLSHAGRSEVQVLSGIVVVDNRSYGNLNLTFFRRDSE